MLKSNIPVFIHDDHLSPMLEVIANCFSFQFYFLVPNEPTTQVSFANEMGRLG